MQQASTKVARKRVVIVDDSLTMRAALDQIFSLRLGFDVVGLASDADSAVSMIAGLQPDLVTIDLHMPYIDGKALLERLSGFVSVHKIIVSAHTSSNLHMIRTLEQLGADACLDKMELSRDPAAFCAKVRAVIGRRKKVVTLSNPSASAFDGAGTSCTYPVPLDERERLDHLRLLGIANDDSDPQFDLITAHLGKTTGFPTCLMTFIDHDQQWVKSAHGLARGAMPRALAFCNYTLCSDDGFAVSDASSDSRFSSNTFVAGAPGVRSYVGFPIISKSGVRLGALCLIDTRPRQITSAMVASLAGMCAIAASIIDTRLQALQQAA